MSVLPVTPWRARRNDLQLIVDAIDAHALARGASGPSPRPLGRLRYRLVATGDASTPLQEPLDLITVRNPGGYDIWSGLVRASREDPFRLSGGGGPFVVEASADVYQTVRFPVVSGSSTERVLFQPGYAYPFDRGTSSPGRRRPTVLSGRLLASDGSGLAGSTIAVEQRPPGQALPVVPYTTGASGRWALSFDGSVETTAGLDLRVTSGDGTSVVVSEVRITRGDSESLRQALLRGFVRQASGRSLSGAVVSVDGVQDVATTTDGEGAFVLAMPIEAFPPSGGPQPLTATARSASGATLDRTVQLLPRATTDVTAFVFP